MRTGGALRPARDENWDAPRNSQRRTQHERAKVGRHHVEDIKGDVYPAVSVANGAVLQANFGAMPFKRPPPEGFSEVILSQSPI
jgi:hypothetical protein